MRFGRFPLAEATGAILAHSVSGGAGAARDGPDLSDFQGRHSLGAAELADIAAAGLDESGSPDPVRRRWARMWRRCASRGRWPPAIRAGGPERGRHQGGVKPAGGACGGRPAGCRGGSRGEPDRPGDHRCDGPALETPAAGRAGGDSQDHPFRGVRKAPWRRPAPRPRGRWPWVPPAVVGATLNRNPDRVRCPARQGPAVDDQRGWRGCRSGLSPRVVVPHRAPAIAAALSAGARRGPDDPDCVGDVGHRRHRPRRLAPRRGAVDHFLVCPSTPANLLFLGRLGDKPVIGLPGCARSPAMKAAPIGC